MLNDPLYKALTILRTDALERNMRDLAVVYGWALMQRGEQIVMAGLKGPAQTNGEL